MKTITLSDADHALVVGVLEEAADRRLAWAREEAEEAASIRKLLRLGVARPPVERQRAAADEARAMARHWRKEARALSRIARSTADE